VAGLLENKVVLLVGASTGIGADAARVFAEEGASVMLAARSADSLEKLATELQDAGFDADFVAADVSSAAEVAHMVDATVERFGRLDGAFNNAGITQSGLLHEVSEEDFDRIMAVNVKGVWLCLREQLRVMRAAGRGAIVTTSSVGGFKGSSGFGAYQATKHAVIGLSRTAAHDNGPAGIRVNVVAPGPVDTPMIRKMPPEMLQQRIDAMPLRKIATGTDVGNAAAWLLSDRAGHISGAVLPVEGGFSA